MIYNIKHANYSEKEQKKCIEGWYKEYPNGIEACGSDALRFGLLAYMIQAGNINLDVQRIVCYRHFCNKIWNVMKFAFPQFKDFTYDSALLRDSNIIKGLPLINKWMLSRMNYCVSKMNEQLTNYKFGLVT